LFFTNSQRLISVVILIYVMNNDLHFLGFYNYSTFIYYETLDIMVLSKFLLQKEKNS